jgi:hypothetical protein
MEGAVMPARALSLAIPQTSRRSDHETGSQTTEYALIMVVAATIASLALAWARNGAIADLLNGVLDHVRSLFGMG